MKMSNSLLIHMICLYPILDSYLYIYSTHFCETIFKWFNINKKV